MNIKLKESDKLFEALNKLDFLEIVHNKPKEGDFQLKVKSESWFERFFRMNKMVQYSRENNEIDIFGDLAYHLDLDQLITLLGIIKLSSKKKEEEKEE